VDRGIEVGAVVLADDELIGVQSVLLEGRQAHQPELREERVQERRLGTEHVGQIDDVLDRDPE
jgi:hypothetical protein